VPVQELMDMTGVLLRTVVRAGAAAEGCNRHYKRQTNNEMIEWFIHIYSF